MVSGESSPRWQIVRKYVLPSAFFAVVLFGANCPATWAYAAGAFDHLQPRHRRVVKAWLTRRGWLRLATEGDCDDKGNLALARGRWGARYHPFYSVADFNRDGHQDFAVMLVVKGKDEMALAIFNGPFTHSVPNYFERKYEKMGTLYLDYNHEVRGHLFLGVFESDWYCVTFYRKGRGYTYRDCVN
jgi:hypothetical protein